MDEMKAAKGDDGRRMAWLLWANAVLEDAPRLQRRMAFPPPDEVDDWVKVRQLVERGRRPRTKLRGSELALLLDVGDYLGELRSTESENAATLECMLHAAWLLWDSYGNVANAGAETIYNHILNGWGLMPPPVESLPLTRDRQHDRESTFRTCRRLMRESDLVPDWYFNGDPIPRELRAEAPPKDVEQAEPPSTSELFGGVDP
jgi:hypothetical protein